MLCSGDVCDVIRRARLRAGSGGGRCVCVSSGVSDLVVDDKNGGGVMVCVLTDSPIVVPLVDVGSSMVVVAVVYGVTGSRGGYGERGRRGGGRRGRGGGEKDIRRRMIGCDGGQGLVVATMIDDGSSGRELEM
ncbi:hypothetical protein Tco_0890825 [Tanacetum coccineum]|uniref:Uncharacterized protein n=1 Tax=Tanacetum coccineum TaxID=301880 RepID=A0ABQ5C2R2_9ASTR